ncbi:MAG: MobA/MobL family protein [Steroidobacteraceae bacterium]
MAIYYLGMRTFGRSRGKSGSRSTSGAAYRAGERIRDERTGRVYDHRRRADVLHKEIVLPAHRAAPSLEWARDRSRLWNAAERAETRANARVARELTVALPHELAPEARTLLARQFAQEIANRYGSAVDLALHAPRGDARNFHAHLLATTREVTPEGLGRKTSLELSGTRRHQLGLPRWREEIAGLRGRWESLANDALERAQVATRVSRLSRAERGLEPSASPRLPLAAYNMERRGARSYLAERIRERHRARLEQRTPGSGRTLLGRLGVRVKAAWHAAQDRLEGGTAGGREPLPVERQSPAPTAMRNEAERLRPAAPERVAVARDEALEAARNWRRKYFELEAKADRTPEPARDREGIEPLGEPSPRRNHDKGLDFGL